MTEPGRAARQLVLDIAHAPSFAADDFLVAPCNEAAHAAVNSWPDWPDRVMLLLGPTGAGKSHLAQIWAARAGACHEACIAAEGRGALLIEDCDRRPMDEPVLFHLLNLARENGGSILLTARAPPGAWGLATPDLLSRLRLAPAAVIGHPDDGLLKAVLIKLFADRQLEIDERLLSFIARRCDRSLDAVRRFVAAVDEEALAQGQRVTRPLAARVLGDLAGSEDDPR